MRALLCTRMPRLCTHAPFAYSRAPFVYPRALLERLLDSISLCVLACPICVSSRPTRAPFRLDFPLCTRVPFMYSYVLCVIARSLCTHAPFCVLPLPVCVLTHPFCTRVPFVYSCALYVLTCLLFSRLSSMYLAPFKNRVPFVYSRP